MFRTTFIITVVLLSAFTQNIKAQKLTVKVEVDFGRSKKILSSEVSKEKSITALEALQLAVTTETHAISGYVFVTSINNVKAERGQTAWYYKVNGQSPKVLAINNYLKDGDVVRWRFTEDVCSKKIDKKTKS